MRDACTRECTMYALLHVLSTSHISPSRARPVSRPGQYPLQCCGTHECSYALCKHSKAGRPLSTVIRYRACIWGRAYSWGVPVTFVFI